MKILPITTCAIAALAMAGCVVSPPPRNYGGGYNSNGYDRGYNGGYNNGYNDGYNANAACADCGVVTRINVVASGRAAAPGAGAVLGGLVGAVIGHETSAHTQGSSGNQNVMSVVGAAAGAIAGNQIQQNVTGDSYDIQVQMDDGRVIMVNQKDLGGVRENSYVNIVNGRVVAR